MHNEKISANLSKHAQMYLSSVTTVFVVAGIICAALFMNMFGFIDSVNSYILATQLFHSMIRTISAATMMTLLIDFISRRYCDE